MPLNLPYFNSVWIHLEEKNTLPLWTSFWIERTDNENSSKIACPWFGSRTVLSCFSEVNFNVPNLMKSTVVICLKISTLSTSYRILTCPTRGAVANNSSLFSDIFARQPWLVEDFPSSSSEVMQFIPRGTVKCKWVVSSARAYSVSRVRLDQKTDKRRQVFNIWYRNFYNKHFFREKKKCF